MEVTFQYMCICMCNDLANWHVHYPRNVSCHCSVKSRILSTNGFEVTIKCQQPQWPPVLWSMRVQPSDQPYSESITSISPHPFFQFRGLECFQCTNAAFCCRSRLADFFTNCQPESRSVSNCLKENYADCLLAYSGLIGKTRGRGRGLLWITDLSTVASDVCTRDTFEDKLEKGKREGGREGMDAGERRIGVIVEQEGHRF